MPRPLFLAAVALAGCAAPDRQPGRVILYEKGRHQTLQGADGGVLRVHYDGNGDRRVDVVTLLDDAGRELRVEVDTDFDGKVDRWEQVVPGTDLQKLAQSRRRTGTPDAWSYVDASGVTLLQELDDDGDGRPDRVEGGRGEPRQGLDTDQDGRPDRWTISLGGRLVAEDVDSDGDGRPDRRLLHGPDGQVLAVEADPDGDGIWEPAVRR